MCNVYCIMYTPRVWFQFASSIVQTSTCMYIVLHTSSLFQYASSIALASTCMYVYTVVLHCMHLEFVPVCLIYSSGFHLHVYSVTLYTPRVCSSLPLLSLEDMTFYLRVVKTIFYERAQRVSKILFLTRETYYIWPTIYGEKPTTIYRETYYYLQRNLLYMA